MSASVTTRVDGWIQQFEDAQPLSFLFGRVEEPDTTSTLVERVGRFALNSANSFLKSFLVGASCGAIICSGVIATVSFLHPEKHLRAVTHPFSISVLIGCFIEEFVFRSCIQCFLLKIVPRSLLNCVSTSAGNTLNGRISKIVRVGLSSALFGLCHYENAGYPMVTAATANGIIWGTIFESQAGMIGAIGAHVGTNFSGLTLMHYANVIFG